VPKGVEPEVPAVEMTGNGWRVCTVCAGTLRMLLNSAALHRDFRKGTRVQAGGSWEDNVRLIRQATALLRRCPSVVA
jgi:hypothetical protein